MTDEKYILIARTLKSQNVDYEQLPILLRHTIIAEYLRQEEKGIDATLRAKLESKELQHFLTRYQIPAILNDEVDHFCNAIPAVAECIPNQKIFFEFASIAYPYQFKKPIHMDKPVHLYIALYMIMAFSSECPDDKIIDGAYYSEHYYDPYEELFCSLEVDMGEFFNLWEAIHYYQFGPEMVNVPKRLSEIIKVCQKKMIQKQTLFSLYVALFQAEKDQDHPAELENPWEYCMKSKKGFENSDITVERGLTVEESFFNEYVIQMRKLNPTDVVNALFYKNRNDAPVEKTILWNAIRENLQDFEKILIVNPSPAFLTTCDSFLSLRKLTATFTVNDETVATAYTLQYRDKWLREAYRFVTIDQLREMDEQFNLVVVIARDMDFAQVIFAIPKCADGAKIVGYLPQTLISGQNSIVEVFDANQIQIDNILALGNYKMSKYGSIKKMIVQATKNKNQSQTADLYMTSYTCDALDKYYTTVDKVRHIPVDWLRRRYTLVQLRNIYDKSQCEESAAQKEAAQIHYFSKEILIHYSYYRERSGRHMVRACYRKILEQGQMRQMGDNLTGYKSVSWNGELEAVTEKLNALPFTEDFEAKIVEEVENHYRHCPEQLTLKTVWFCNRDIMQSRLLTYDDQLAMSLFCGEKQQLADLVIGQATRDDVLNALAQVATDGLTDQRYYRLIKQIYQTAVRRGYLEESPFSDIPVKSLTQELDLAMKELRAALRKNALSISELRKVMDFLREPVDAKETPRVVKESCWLIPLIRLCTGMPLREVCALQWKHFKRLENDEESYQLQILQHINDQGKITPLTTYEQVRQYRKIPCVTILKEILLQRYEYILQEYHISSSDVLEQPIIYAEEPGVKRRGRRKTNSYCTIRQGRKVSVEAMQKAEIGQKVITLLEGEDAFQEDLNARRNDLYYSNFVHYANTLCGLEDGQVCYLVGRKGPDTYSEHYVDYRNDFIQMDMAQRLDRLWPMVLDDETSQVSYEERVQCEKVETTTVDPSGNGLKTINMLIETISGCEEGDITIRVESTHGVQGSLTVFSKEVSQ